MKRVSKKVGRFPTSVIDGPKYKHFVSEKKMEMGNIKRKKKIGNNDFIGLTFLSCSTRKQIRFARAIYCCDSKSGNSPFVLVTEGTKDSEYSTILEWVVGDL